MVSEAIILAGGFGTRIKDRIQNLPKALAPVKGKPFIYYLLDYLEQEGIKKIIMSTGYLSDKIQEQIGRRYSGMSIAYSVENKPLGTGGAIMLAYNMIRKENFLVLNGDTLYKTSLKEVYRQHQENTADISIALRKVEDAGRYGRVILDDANRVKSFSEKTDKKEEAYINAGIYLIRKKQLTKLVLPESFSIERELIPGMLNDYRIYGVPGEAYFIDIGTPEDYERAQHEI